MTAKNGAACKNNVVISGDISHPRVNGGASFFLPRPAWPVNFFELAATCAQICIFARLFFFSPKGRKNKIVTFAHGSFIIAFYDVISSTTIGALAVRDHRNNTQRDAINSDIVAAKTWRMLINPFVKTASQIRARERSAASGDFVLKRI